MKRIIVPGVLLLMGVTGEVLAVCNSGGTRVSDLAGASGLLKGNTVCDGAAGNWNAQEQHRDASGSVKNLWDYKHGTDTSDPTAPIGTWRVDNDGGSNATVTYGYYKNTNNPGDGTNDHTYSVWNMGAGSYDFCSNDTTKVATVSVKSGLVGCDSSAAPVVLSAPARIAPATPTLRPTLRPRSRP